MYFKNENLTLLCIARSNIISLLELGDNVEFEIVEFYPNEGNNKQRRIGTLHVRITTLGIELRGISVFVRKNKVIIIMPKDRYLHTETKTIRFYPIFTMTDKGKYHAFLGKFMPALKKYVREKLGMKEKLVDNIVEEE